MASRMSPGTQSDAVDLQTFLEGGFYLPRNSLTRQEGLSILRSSHKILSGKSRNRPEANTDDNVRYTYVDVEILLRALLLLFP